MTWILSISSLITVYLIGQKKLYGWYVGLAGQSMWIAWELATRNYGLMPMTIVMTGLYINSAVKWKKHD